MNSLFKERLRIVVALLVTVVASCCIGLAISYALQWLVKEIPTSISEEQLITATSTVLFILCGAMFLITMPYILYQLWLFIKWLFIEPFKKNEGLSIINDVEIEEGKRKTDEKND